MPSFFLHTNIPAPYRQHQFEAISAAFPGSKVFFSDRMHSDRPWTDEFAHWKVPCRRLKHQIFLPKLGYISLDLIPEILRQPPGTIHLVGACGGNVYLLRLLGRIRGGRLVFWNDGGFIESITPRYLHMFTRWLLPAYFAAFTAGVIGRNYCRHLGLVNEQIFNAFLSHDARLYDRLRREHGEEYRRRIRAELGIADNAFVMINVSRLLDLKRLEDLKDALLILDGRFGTNAHIILIGDGTHRQLLDEMPSALRNIRLHHIPSVAYDDMPAWYAAADLLVFPSEGDIWGLVVNEALSMGVPVICTSRIGAAELVRDGENGFKVPVRAPAEIATRIWQLYQDRQLLNLMKANSTDIVNHWNTDLTVHELQRLSSF